jgi:hypothetical protein
MQEGVNLPTELTLEPMRGLIKQEIYKFIEANMSQLKSLANKGVSSLAGVMSSKLSTPIVKAILSNIDPKLKSIISGTLPNLIDNELRKLLHKSAEEIVKCAGTASVTATASAGKPIEPTKKVVMQQVSKVLDLQQTARMAQTDPQRSAAAAGELFKFKPSWETEASSSTPSAATSSNLPLIIGAAAVAALLLTRMA